MKKSLLFTLLGAIGVAAMSLGFTSCIDSDSQWWGDPPYGYNYNDSRLAGYWQLVQYNSDPVSTNSANWLYFNGNGYGRYYYFDRGYQQSESLRYWSQQSVSGASNYQLNIQYEYSSPLTTSYWFTHGNNTLWMQWQTAGGRVQTYVYDRVNRAPW